MKIMVAGGYDNDTADSLSSRNIVVFGRSLARRIVKQGHTLVCGNLNSFDQEIIEAACIEEGLQKRPPPRIISYVPKDAPAFVNKGRVLKSQLGRWDRIGRRLLVPEPIQEADIIVLVGGWDGTHTAANWAKIAGKPILPVASFGLAAEEIFAESDSWVPRFKNKVGPDDLAALNRAIHVLADEQADVCAQDVITLAERVVVSKDVFVVMSFREDDSLEQAVTAIEEVCREFGFSGIRLDRVRGGATYEITDRIEEGLRRSAFVIADLTDSRPNVYYELGYARALGKPVILTAHRGTDVHFDVQGLQRIEWIGFLDLRSRLREAVGSIAEQFGLTPLQWDAAQ